MRLYAISDLHVGYKINAKALEAISPRLNDWLILAGDVGETPEHLAFAFNILLDKFKQLIWVPGNHELWTVPQNSSANRGMSKYLEMVSVCRKYGVLTPEDSYPVVDFDGKVVRIAPLFLLYDYSFRPDDVPFEMAIQWASDNGVQCTDELLLHTDPYPNVISWCHERCKEAQVRLGVYKDGLPTVLINHFPLRQDLVWIPRIPHFSLWCGTRLTEDWHIRFKAEVVVSGHLHVRSTRTRHRTRFEEVSLGYPSQWNRLSPIDDYLREILPGPA